SIAWLRQAMTAELARLRAEAQDRRGEADEAWHSRLAPAARVQFPKLLAMPVQAFCDIVSLEQQMALVLALQRSQDAVQGAAEPTGAAPVERAVTPSAQTTPAPTEFR